MARNNILWTSRIKLYTRLENATQRKISKRMMLSIVFFFFLSRTRYHWTHRDEQFCYAYEKGLANDRCGKRDKTNQNLSCMKYRCMRSSISRHSGRSHE